MVASTIIELDDRDLRRSLTLLQRRGANLHPALDEIGEEWVGSVKQNFDAGGRPTRWPRKSGGEASRLQDTRRLRNSITHRASSGDVQVGTNVRYARLMHFGGTVRPRKSKYLAIPIGDRRELRAGARAFIRRQEPGTVFMTFKSGGRGTIFVRTEAGIRPIFALRRKVEIKPRPFLLAHPQDVEAFRQILSRHVLRGQA